MTSSEVTLPGLGLPPLAPNRAESDLVQARYELHRALDRGTSADRAEWCGRWGEALLDRLDRRQSDYAPLALRPSPSHRSGSKQAASPERKGRRK